jgi:acyl-CoA thioesterase-1
MLGGFARVAAVAAGVAAGSLCFAAGSAIAAPAPVIVAHTTDASVSGPMVVGIGDSILEGHGLADGESWLADLAEQSGWRLTNLASDGSGFVTVGNDGDTFADQVAAAAKLDPDVVVISGSSNDLGAANAAIASATTATIDALHAALPAAEIIAVSAVWGDTATPAQLDDISSDVADATIAVGGTYLDIGQPLASEPGLMQSDDVHPTAEGQVVLASAVSAAMLRAHVTL